MSKHNTIKPVQVANTNGRYVDDILKNTSKSTDQVTIQPDGQWELHISDQSSKPNGVASTSDDDDDLVEVTKSGDSVRMGTPRPYGTPLSAKPPISREQSTASSVPPRSAGSISSKRPRPAVIDLTSSGDEDEEPLARAPKRQFSSYGQPVAPLVYRSSPASSFPPRH